MNLHGTMEISEQGVLQIGGIGVTELVKEFSSPLIVIDEAEFRQNIREYDTAFEENYKKYTVAYGAKAFINKTVCRILADEGIGLDVVSGGELYIALQSGYPAENIYFHGNNKLKNELEMAVDNDIGRFMIDNSQEALMLDRIAKEKEKKVKAILRVIPGIEAHTHEYIMTGHIDSKFGVSFEGDQVTELIKKIRSLENVELTGIHAHIGSQIFDIEPYQKLIEIFFSYLEKLRQNHDIIISELDLGGGLGISHTKAEDPPPISKYIEVITSAVKHEADKKNYPLPEIIVEPGRSLIGTAGTTLYTIGSIKKVPGNSTYVAIDGGMTDNIRPALYDAEYDAIVANRCHAEKEEEVTIAGKCCESGDILVKDIKLPEVKSGDILAVPATGAYTYSMANNYNGIPRPAVVIVNDGDAHLIVKRESYQDLVNRDLVPPGY